MLTQPIQILLVEDSTADAVLLGKEMAQSPFGPFSIRHVQRLDAAQIQLQQHSFDAVLLDLGLPDSQGLTTLQRLLKHSPRGTPVVVLTGTDNESLGMAAIQQGAADYLVKDGFGAAGMRPKAIRYAVERQRAREAFLETEKRLAMAVEAAQMGIFEWDLQSGKIVWSHHHERLFGLKQGDFNGCYEMFRRCVHPDDQAAVKEKCDHALSTGEEYQHEYRVIWPNGSEHWIEGRGRIFGDEDGKAQRMLGTVVDISDRKAAAEAARAREAELAHLARVSTLEMMASGLAHELNQPLSAILNYASVCQTAFESQSGSGETSALAVREIMNETRRAGAIISRMRSFVRKQQPRSVPVDINQLVRESIGMMDFELRHQGIRPQLHLAPDLPKVLGDTVQIEQVLVNLLFNALEAMGDGPASKNRLSVETSLGNEGSGVQACIIDTGCGITPENLRRLFEPFFTTKAKGLGMGLNISRSIIESHGGRLTAAPYADRGMAFCFTLPVPKGV